MTDEAPRAATGAVPPARSSRRSGARGKLHAMPTAPKKRPYAPRMPPEQRREQLLDAALKIIIEEGYAAVSIESIARDAGVTRPVVYGLFANLGELLLTLLDREERRALVHIGRALPRAANERDPDELLVEGVLAFVRAVLASPDTWRLVLLPPEGTPEPVRDRVTRDRDALLGQLEEFVAWSIERRGGPSGLDVELLARSVLLVAEDAGRLALIDAERYAPERIARYAATLLSLAPPRMERPGSG